MQSVEHKVPIGHVCPNIWVEWRAEGLFHFYIGENKPRKTAVKIKS